MASDLISRKALLERLEKWNTPDCIDKAFYEFTKSRINEQPTVDAVEVVRCRNCRYKIKNVFGLGVICDKVGAYMEDDAFCSFGAKMDGGDRK